MKILRVEVDDPGRRGYANKPTLKVWTDERPKPTGDVIITTVGDGHYRHQHHGPFVAFSWYYSDVKRNTGGLNGGGWSSRAGAFNVNVKPTKQVMDVTLFAPPFTNTGDAGFALEIDRAAREMKKYTPEWILVVDGDAAKEGDITWRPEELIPSCLWRGKFSPAMAGDPAPCLEVAYHPYMGRAQGLCDKHKVEHDALAAANRAKQDARKAGHWR